MLLHGIRTITPPDPPCQGRRLLRRRTGARIVGLPPVETMRGAPKGPRVPAQATVPVTRRVRMLGSRAAMASASWRAFGPAEAGTST